MHTCTHTHVHTSVQCAALNRIEHAPYTILSMHCNGCAVNNRCTNSIHQSPLRTLTTCCVSSSLPSTDTLTLTLLGARVRLRPLFCPHPSRPRLLSSFTVTATATASERPCGCPSAQHNSINSVMKLVDSFRPLPAYNNNQER